MKAILELLGRQQFSNLKSLAVPYKINLGKTGIKEIAARCPHLETFDVGYSFTSGIKMKDTDLVDAVEHFTSLTGIHMCKGWSTPTNSAIESVVKAMAGNLLDLRIRGDEIMMEWLSDDTLSVIATSCPNLKHFAYSTGSRSYYNSEKDLLSGEGVIALIRGCRRLEVLELEGSRKVGKDAFVTITNMVAQGGAASVGKSTGNDDEGEYALRKINLKGYPFVIVGFPFRIEADPTYKKPHDREAALAFLRSLGGPTLPGPGDAAGGQDMGEEDFADVPEGYGID